MKMERRTFLKSSGLISASLLCSRFPTIAGPFTRADFLRSPFPQDKKLDPQWVKSLFKRGKATTYLKTKNELRYIGMPVGGICCGTVYLGGDGRLWVWDIFNQNQMGAVNKVLPIKLEQFNVNEVNNSFGSLYLEPANNVHPLQQGFALIIRQKNTVIVKRLHHDDWDEIIFEATYPVAKIQYVDDKLALKVTLQAFSPFIPGDAYHSGLPVTNQSISVENLSGKAIIVDVVGWLENKVLLHSEKKNGDFTRINSQIDNPSCKGIFLTCAAADQTLTKAADYGSMAIISLSKPSTCIDDFQRGKSAAFAELRDFVKLTDNSPVAIVGTTHTLQPKQKGNSDFIISWYMPHISFREKAMTEEGADFHFYTKDFADASSVAIYTAEKYQTLKEKTLLWNQTWYDSTLPWWFLERTFSTISNLATTTAHRFKSGRFYAWEGIGCCHGTCTHVWQYAHAMARIFPEMEKDTRERVDLGVGYDEKTGQISIRGEKTGPSIDGQAGTILRFYREHLMSSDGAFLHNHWDKIKKAISFVMRLDKNKDGMTDTPMENTLDALWSGEISWIVGLAIASARAGEEMAKEMGDLEFALLCREYCEKGKQNMEQYLFNGEYFIHRPDPAEGKKGVGSYNTCHIDQVYGQCWAWQVGLGRILNKEKTMSALQALWKYNFMPDVGPYIATHKGGRFYAVAGEGGMVMNTNPKKEEKPYGEAEAWQIGYFSECMTGFEHQVASHMMAEGMIEESMVLTRMIHDRYHAFRRNPFNEIECSDHYARSMASYGTFINACGFTYHGPLGQIGFAPRFSSENFKAPFTAAEGWGSYSQQSNKKEFSAQLNVHHGKLNLRKLNFELDKNLKASSVRVALNSKQKPSRFTQNGRSCIIEFSTAVVVLESQALSVTVL